MILVGGTRWSKNLRQRTGFVWNWHYTHVRSGPLGQEVVKLGDEGAESRPVPGIVHPAVPHQGVAARKVTQLMKTIFNLLVQPLLALN